MTIFVPLKRYKAGRQPRMCSVQGSSTLISSSTRNNIRLASLFVLASVVVAGFAAPTQKPDAEVILDDIKNVVTQLVKLKGALAVFPNECVKKDHVNVLDMFPQVVYLIWIFLQDLFHDMVMTKDSLKDADKVDVRQLFSIIADRFPTYMML
jgi:hypothetical protein